MENIRERLTGGAALLLCVWILWLFGATFGFSYVDPAAREGEEVTYEVTCDAPFTTLFGLGNQGVDVSGLADAEIYTDVAVACNAARGGRAALIGVLALPTALLFMVSIKNARRADDDIADPPSARLTDLHRVDDES